MNVIISIHDFGDLSAMELYDILKLRQEVFIVEQDCAYLDADGLDKISRHACGRNTQNQLVAYTRILPPGTQYSKYAAIGRVVTHPSVRGIGIGKKIMLKSVAACEELFPGFGIKLSAQTYLIKFYNALGFVQTGKTYLEDGIPHIAMVHERKNA